LPLFDGDLASRDEKRVDYNSVFWIIVILAIAHGELATWDENKFLSA